MSPKLLDLCLVVNVCNEREKEQKEGRRTRGRERKKKSEQTIYYFLIQCSTSEMGHRA